MSTTSKVLFVNPSWDRYISKRGERYNRYWPPLDLLSCAGVLETHGIECHLWDQRIDNGSRISTEDYDLIFATSSPLDRWQCPNLDWESFADRIKTFPKDRTYVLGAHGTMHPEYVARAVGKAGVICEEPEEAVLRIALGDDKRTISGLTYLDNGTVIVNPVKNPPPLDELPAPAYHLVDIHHYSYELMGENFALLEASRGCPHSCTYCYLGMYPKYRLKSPERVVQEVRTLLSTTATRNIYFIDLEFAINRRHTEGLLDALINSGLKFRWCCQTRADSVDLEILRKMKAAGCTLVHYGVETGSSRVMDMVGKQLTLDDVRLAIQLTRKAGLHSACFFLIGFPTESRAEINQTIAFAKTLNPTYASFHTVTPYLDTSMYEDFPVPQDGHFIQETYPQALPLAELKTLKRKAYLEYYLRPDYLLSHVLGSPRGSWRKARLFLEFLAAG